MAAIRSGSPPGPRKGAGSFPRCVPAPRSAQEAANEPGGAIEHVEHWFLWRGVPAPRDDNDVDRHLLPKLALPKLARLQSGIACSNIA